MGEENTTDYCPRLRIAPEVAEINGQKMLIFQDESRITEDIISLPVELVFLLRRFDGNHTLRDIQEILLKETSELVPIENILEVVDLLDRYLLLDSPRFREHMLNLISAWDEAPARPFSHAGAAYPEDPSALIELLDSGYTTDGGPGKPDPGKGPFDLKGIFAPHMNPKDTAAVYAHAYKALLERSQASLFIILGTAHFESQQYFILTEKDYQTPLGVAATDRNFISAVKNRLYDCSERTDLSHKNEHSIEFQLLFLQHALQGKRDFMIAPILVSSLGVSTLINESPKDDPTVRQFLQAMRETVAEDSREVCFITSGDLAHLGPQYGDEKKFFPLHREEEENNDREMLAPALLGDPEGLFMNIARTRDARRICGFPPLYIMLSLMKAERGELLKWSYWSFESTRSMVTMAAMGFFGV